MKKNLLLTLLITISFSLYSQEEEAIAFVLADTPPITYDCDKNENDEELKICFVKSVTNQVVSKIDGSLLQNQGLNPDKYTIYASFTINKKGKVKKVKISSFENEVISNEIEQAVKSIRKMTPAYLDGKPVNVNYTLPISFYVK